MRICSNTRLQSTFAQLFIPASPASHPPTRWTYVVRCCRNPRASYFQAKDSSVSLRVQRIGVSILMQVPILRRSPEYGKRKWFSKQT